MRNEHEVTWYLLLLVLLEVAEDDWFRGLIALTLIAFAITSIARRVKERMGKQDSN